MGNWGAHSSKMLAATQAEWPFAEAGMGILKGSRKKAKPVLTNDHGVA